MKKYTSILSIFAFVLILYGSFGASHALAYDSGCTGVGLYSQTTGQLCSGSPVSPYNTYNPYTPYAPTYTNPTTTYAYGCTSAGPFNIITGQPTCGGGQVYPQTTYAPTYSNPVATQQFYLWQTGPSVAALQQTLASAGFYYGRIDGIYGPITANAYARYQAQYAYTNPTPYPVYPPTTPVQGIAPVISGVNGPQTVSINQQGTWTVSAYSQNGGNLSYSVVWGDENIYPYATNNSLYAAPSQQNATFTHTYAQAGNYVPRFTVTNAYGQTVTTSLSVNVTSYYNNNSSLVINTTTLPNATLGSSYSATISATGGTGNYSWSVTSGSLPSGLSLITAQCFSYPCQAGATISGVPNTQTNSTFQVSVTDGVYRAYQTFTINFYGGTSTSAPTIYSISPTSGTVGTQVTIYGTGFSTNGCTVYSCNNSYSPNTINVGGNIIQNVYSTNGTSLTFTVPSYQYSSSTTYPVSVTNGYGTSNAINFTVFGYVY